LTVDEPIHRHRLPWLEATWRRLWSAHCEGRLGHALLLSGPAGIGKRALADQLAQALMCTAPAADGSPCGRCQDCRLVLAGNHPDLTHLTPDSEGQGGDIKVDQVRALCSQQTLTANRGTLKVLQILPAERMNPVAANSLLKTLEEPVASTLWILISEDPTRLTQTIRSRCQRISLTTPPEAEALPWLRQQRPDAETDLALLLRLAHGAPLIALAMIGSERVAERASNIDAFVAVGQGRRDPVAVADAWQHRDPALVLEALVGWVCDLLRLQAHPETAYLCNPDQRGALTAMAATIDPRACHQYLQTIYQARALVEATINKQLLFESLLVRWAALAKGQFLNGR
jgi:DNA polymerase-3 subunit delta'